MAIYRTPHMNIPIPDNNEPGPQYAQASVSDSLYALGEMTHDGINTGPLLNVAAQYVGNDFSMDGYNVTNARAVRLVNNGGPLTGISDLIEIYSISGDLYYNDNAGNVIRLTENGQPVAGASSVGIAFNILAVTNANHTITSSETYTVYDISTSSSALAITLPIAANVQPGRLYYFYDVGNNAAAQNITIQVNNGSGNTIVDGGTTGNTTLVLKANGMSGFIYTDGVATWYASLFNQSTYYGQEINLTNDSVLAVESSSYIDVQSTGLILVESGGEIVLESGGTVEALSGGIVKLDAGSLVQTVGAGPTLSGNYAGAPTFTGTPVFGDGFTANGGTASFTNTNSIAGFTTIAGSLYLAPYAFNPGTSGTVTLNFTEYANPVIDITQIASLSGSLTLIFPKIAQHWKLLVSTINFGSNTLIVKQATSGDLFNFNGTYLPANMSFGTIDIFSTTSTFSAGSTLYTA